MTVAITLRAGLGRNLTAAEVDANFTNLKVAVETLQTDRPLPNGIESVQLVGSKLSFTMDDGTVLGPLTVPALMFRWRGEWAPFTIYSTLDTFTVAGLGIYTVLLDHSAGDVFDAAIMVGGVAALQKLFGMTATTGDTIYDVGFFYQDHLSASVSDRLFGFATPRSITIPIAAAHQAYLDEAPTVAAQVMPVYWNGVQIGHIDFAIGAQTGTVTITAASTLAIGDRLEVGVPALSDPTAQGLSVIFAAQRVL